jgi:hypothetical protein
MTTDAAYGATPASVDQAFLSDISGFQNSPNSLQQILGQIGGAIAPGMSAADLQAALAGNQFGTNLSQYQLTGTNLINQAANQLGQYGISAAQLGLQGQGLQAEAGLLGTTSALEQQEQNIQWKQYPEQLAEAALNYKNNQTNLTGNLAASGALNTTGSQQQQNLLSQNYQWQTTDIERAAEESALQQKGALAQQQYSAADIARQQQNLALVAQANGLSQQEVVQQLGYGLKQAGLDVQQSIPQLLNSLTQIYGGDLSQVEGAVGQLGLLGGTPLGQAATNSGVNLYSPGVSSGG